jgi:hypothetical protein
MDDADLTLAILRGLLPWDRLPETDLLRRLPPAQLARFGREALDRLARDGLITLRQVGDEPVIALTDAGRRAASGRR